MIISHEWQEAHCRIWAYYVCIRHHLFEQKLHTATTNDPTHPCKKIYFCRGNNQLGGIIRRVVILQGSTRAPPAESACSLTEASHSLLPAHAPDLVMLWFSRNPLGWWQMLMRHLELMLEDAEGYLWSASVFIPFSWPASVQPGVKLALKLISKRQTMADCDTLRRQGRLMTSMELARSQCLHWQLHDFIRDPLPIEDEKQLACKKHWTTKKYATQTNVIWPVTAPAELKAYYVICKYNYTQCHKDISGILYYMKIK